MQLSNLQRSPKRPLFIVSILCVLSIVSWGVVAQEPAESVPAETVPAEPVPAETVPTGAVEPTAEDPSAADPAEDAEPTRPVEIVKAQIVGPPGHRDVQRIRRLIPGAGRVDWSRQGNWIAFDRPGEDGRYDVFLHNIDSGSERCLNCDRYELRQTNVLDPVWHPSGEYLVVQVQTSPRRLKFDPIRLATPNRGIHSDLYVIPRDGRDAWKITRIAENGGAVVDPHFSYEGGHLVWSRRVASVGARWGDWEFQIAEFRIRRGLPKLGKVVSHRPTDLPPGFVVASEFTPNDRGLLIAAVPGSAPVSGRDVLRFDLDSDKLERITSTADQWDDRLTQSPKGDRLVWVSDRGIPRRGELPYRGDLWFRDEPTGRQERLTFFNDSDERRPKSDHSLGEALIDDIAWDPSGKRLALHVVSPVEDTFDDDGPAVEQALYIVELGEAFQR